MIIQPYINEQFNGIIWRMEIDELSETLIVEIRNNEEKKAFFGSVSLTNGKVYFKDYSTPERWLTGIEAAYDGVMLLHNYQSETGPAHKGVVAVDAITAEVLWGNYNYSFDHLSANGPVIYDTRIQPRKLFLANIKTGATSLLAESSVYEGLKNQIVVPEMIKPELIPIQYMPVPPVGDMVHYLAYNNFRIVSLHASNNGKLSQYIFVYQGVNLVYEDLLNTDIQKIQPEAFILHKNRLLYIKNKSQLKVLSL